MDLEISAESGGNQTTLGDATVRLPALWCSSHRPGDGRIPEPGVDGLEAQGRAVLELPLAQRLLRGESGHREAVEPEGAAR